MSLPENKLAVEELDIPGADRQKILSGNARTLLRLDR